MPRSIAAANQTAVAAPGATEAAARQGFMASNTTGKPIECSAAVAWKAGEALSVERIQVAPPQQGEVRLRVLATGVCHTDAYTLSGADAEGAFPCILGHEGGCIVESVGLGVTSVATGDHVIPLYTAECKTCKFCISGKTNLCSRVRTTQGQGLMPDGTSRFRGGEGFKTPIFHYMGCSTFSQYTVVAEVSVAKVRPDAPLEKICLLGCGVTTGIGAVTNTCKVEEGASVAVFGLGGVGLSAVLGAAISKAAMIIAIDINPSKFELAKKLGATHCVNPKSDVGEGETIVSKLVEMSDGGLDYTIECIGSVKTMRDALEACHKGWGVSCVVGVAPSGAEIATRPFQLVTGRVWKGSAFGGVKGRSELPGLVDRYMSGELAAMDEFISQVLPLDGVNTSLDDMHAGKTIRTVLAMS